MRRRPTALETVFPHFSSAKATVVPREAIELASPFAHALMRRAFTEYHWKCACLSRGGNRPNGINSNHQGYVCTRSLDRTGDFSAPRYILERLDVVRALANRFISKETRLLIH